MISSTNMSKLLGRPLTPAETSNYNTYITGAIQMLDTLLCTNIASTKQTRVYRSKIDMSEVFIDPFTTITSVTINGTERTDYTVKQNDNYTADWYNILEFNSTLKGEKVTVEAKWGFSGCPVDLEQLVAKLFVLSANPVKQNSDVKRKKIEDVEVEYFSNDSGIESLQRDYAGVIAKYGNCQGYLLHGGYDGHI